MIPLTTMVQEGVFKLVSILPGGTTDEMKRLKAEYIAANPDVKKANEARLERGKKGIGEGLSESDRITLDPTMTQEEKKAARAALGGGGSGPRNLRNNNPGNIEYGDFARSHGATGSDGRFAVFPNKAAGSGAMDALLQSYSKQGLNTVSGIVGKWAPPSENNSGAYARSVALRMGVTPNQQLDLQDPRVASAMAREMSRIEGSADAYADKQIPGVARPATNYPGSLGKLGGTLDINLLHSNGIRETRTAELSGTFGQTYAGRGGRA
jgi:hypothetical protein